MGRSVDADRAWEQELRSRGYRLTAQRRQVLDAVARLGHATPEDIHQAVGEGANLSTVYRTLELLEELELVRHTHLSHSSPSYSLAGSTDHVHLVCRTCGAVAEAEAGLLDGAVARLRSDQGFAVDVGHVALFGTCRACGESPGRSAL